MFDLERMRGPVRDWVLQRDDGMCTIKGGGGEERRGEEEKRKRGGHCLPALAPEPHTDTDRHTCTGSRAFFF